MNQISNIASLLLTRPDHGLELRRSILTESTPEDDTTLARDRGTAALHHARRHGRAAADRT
ncbi:hypothetical protein [Amycolatopsis pigmentata]|uniref:Ankyrin repeat-containing protein n=1 Tax=Amycolatopsis pigmentata TaxID=450801 RepID=A0ABW5FID6_9PSEU